MNAARVRLKVSSEFVVHQLKSDYAWAVGELTPVKGGATRFVAFRNQAAGGWRAIWSGRTDGPAGARRADPRFSRKVIASIDWTGKPSTPQILVAARRLAPLNGSARVTGAKIADVTRDSRGRWWAAVYIDTVVDPGGIVVYRDGGTWKCGAGFGTDLPGIIEALPRDVRLAFD